MRCFSSPGSPPTPMNSAQDTPKGVGFPIRKSPDQSLLATPRGLSQRATSFIASRCQGIHQMPFSRLRATSIRRDKPKTHERSREKTLPEPPTDLPPRQRGGTGTHQRSNTYSQCQRTKTTGGVKRRPPKPVSTSTPIRPIPPARYTHRALVEANGFEPMTSCLQSRCSPN